jgi:hypothetical protein
MEKCWESLSGLKQAKGVLQGSAARRTKELLKLNRNQFAVGDRTMQPERTPLQNGITGEPQL